ncbi:retrovirus-related pol polyprotein from transposon TNT 1-94 [Tanacetum coccineum]
MHEDYEYVKSLEKEVDELESKKADFSNIYDLLLEECVPKDDLKAQLQDKNIAISELKKLIEKCKGKSVETQSKERLNLLHMDLCGPMRVASINGKKYILVIVDDYSRYTWTLFFYRIKDETPEVVSKDFSEDSTQSQIKLLGNGHAEDNNNDQALNASFQEAEFINLFCTRVQEIGESSSRNIDNTDMHNKVMIIDGPEIIH